jgi:hypothetical protein
MLAGFEILSVGIRKPHNLTEQHGQFEVANSKFSLHGKKLRQFALSKKFRTSQTS